MIITKECKGLQTNTVVLEFSCTLGGFCRDKHNIGLGLGLGLTIERFGIALTANSNLYHLTTFFSLLVLYCQLLLHKYL